MEVRKEEEEEEEEKEEEEGETLEDYWARAHRSTPSVDRTSWEGTEESTAEEEYRMREVEKERGGEERPQRSPPSA